MKQFFTKYFGMFGLAFYYPVALILRIPVFVFLVIFLTLVLLIWDPITGRDYQPNWTNRLYDWYCGK